MIEKKYNIMGMMGEDFIHDDWDKEQYLKKLASTPIGKTTFHDWTQHFFGMRNSIKRKKMIDLCLLVNGTRICSKISQVNSLLPKYYLRQ